MQAVGHAKIVLYRAALASNRQVVVLIDDRREENENKYAFHSSEKSQQSVLDLLLELYHNNYYNMHFTVQ